MTNETLVKRLKAHVAATNKETVAGRIGVSVRTIDNWLAGKLPRSMPTRNALVSAMSAKAEK